MSRILKHPAHPTDTVEQLPPSPGQLVRTRAWNRRGFQIGAGILIVLILVAVFAPYLAPHHPFQQSLPNRLLPLSGSRVATGLIHWEPTRSGGTI